MRIASRGNLRTAGRVAVWLVVIIVIGRGLVSLAGASNSNGATPAATPTPEKAWPDDQAKAFAIDFAAAYLYVNPHADQASRTKRLQQFMGASLASQATPQPPGTPGAKQVPVPQLSVASATPDCPGCSTGTVTVSAGDRRLLVPISRDKNGRLAVSDLPAFVATPRVADVAQPGSDILEDPSGEIRALIIRFIGAYVAGDAAATSYLSVPDAQLGALAHPMTLVSVDGVSEAGKNGAALAEARIKGADGTVFAVRYRLWVQKRDRWLIAKIADGRG